MSLSDAAAQSWQWKVRDRVIDLRKRTLVMGILNVTPDSFSDGGRYLDSEAAIQHGCQLAEDGADIIDIGAESCRPGRADALTDEEEWARLEPVLTELRGRYPDVLLSVDTYRAATARHALDAGADIINDIYALRHSPEIARHCADADAGLIVMHMQGTPDTMQANPQYGNVLAEIRSELQTAIETAVEQGLPESNVVVDPGIGFGKTVEHNVEILAGLEYLRLIQRPICVGASRKSFLGALTGDLPVEEREDATIAAHCAAVLQGATIIRTHNVVAARRSLAVVDALRLAMDI